MANGLASQFDFSSTGKAHFIGIGGAGMSSLARLLAKSGWTVTGSDQLLSSAAIRAFPDLNCRVHAGHQQSHIQDGTKLVVHSLAIHESNPECQRADELCIPRFSYPQMLGMISRKIPTVAIAGTHGKTTTTAIVSWILANSGRKISHVFGGNLLTECPQSPLQDAEHLVVEACEFQRSLLELKPAFGIVLNEEADHFDCYPTLNDTKNVFQKFRQRLRSTDGLINFNDWSAKNYLPTKTGMEFDACFENEFLAGYSVPLHGKHNLENALAAIAVCRRLGIEDEAIQLALSSFPGVRRRLQQFTSFLSAEDTLLFDDYAHHPTAVAITLETLRAQFPDRRIVCVFQPHQVRRTRELMIEFSKAFQHAEKVFLTPIFAAREKTNGEEFSTAIELVRHLQLQGQSATFVPSLDQIRATLDDACLPGDVVITMGAGDIERIHNDGTGRIQRHHAS